MKYYFHLFVATAIALAALAASFPYITSTGNVSVSGTNFNHEVVVTNGLTLGGVRNTAWPAGGSTNMMVAALAPNTTIAPTFAISGLSTTAASCRRLTIRIPLTNNVTTVSAPAGTLIDGDTMVWEVLQDGTGNRTVTGWDGVYAFGTDLPIITLTTNANKRDFLTFVYNSTATKWYTVGFIKGF